MRPRLFTIVITILLGASFCSCKLHIGQNASSVVVGPYPVKGDLDNLKQHGITKVVSLLDSTDMYEDTLLLREEAYARDAGLGYQNFSMPRDSTSARFLSKANAVASSIASSEGKIYLHSYLTSTRTLSVEHLLRQERIFPTVYILLRRAGTELTYALDSAAASYQASHFQEVLTILSGHAELDRESQLLKAWATYHLNRIDETKAEFDSVLRTHPDNQGANIGAGYCDYRENDLHDSDSLFSYVISIHADAPSANAGLGLVRYKEGKVPDAVKYLRNSLRIDPINVEAGNLLLKIQDSLHKNPNDRMTARH